MASAVDICNLALAHLGNRAQVVAIDPVDGSVEADYCARFYPIARDEILELGDWSFARSREELAQLSVNPSNLWSYAYSLPSDCLVPRRIITGNAALYEDDSADFEVEGSTLLTNKETATLIYTRPVTDPTKFSTSFVVAVSYKLAAYLTGPVLRGEAGATTAAKMHQVAATKVAEAMSIDSARSGRSGEYVPSMVSARDGTASATAWGDNPVIYPPSGYAIS
jgi:hypothetical protein